MMMELTSKMEENNTHWKSPWQRYAEYEASRMKRKNPFDTSISLLMAFTRMQLKPVSSSLYFLERGFQEN